MSFHKKRAKYTFSDSSKDTLEGVARQIRKLSSLLDNCDTRTRSNQQERCKITTKDKLWASFIQQIRKHASSLHSALQNGWRCSCAVPHAALLRLEQRTSTLKTAFFVLGFRSLPSQGSSEILRDNIKVVASLSVQQDVVPSAVLPEKIGLAPVGYLSKLRSNIDISSPEDRGLVVHNEIAYASNRALKPASRLSRLRQRSPQPLESDYTKSQIIDDGCSEYVLSKILWILLLITTHRVTLSRRPKKSVQFSVPPPIQHSHSAPTLTTTSTKLSQSEAPVEIEDLCSSLATMSDDSTYLGYLQDLEQRHHELHRLDSHNEQAREGSVQLVTLGSLLDKTERPDWRLKPRLQLALILASALLQLQTTPWTTGRFTKNDIFVETCDGKILSSHPYIQNIFVTQSSSGSKATNLRGLVKRITRASFVSLGILLLELLNNCHIETQYSPRGCEPCDGRSIDEVNGEVADIWMEEIQEQTVIEYYDAVKACFEHEVTPDWTDEAFITSTHARIVKNLEAALDHYGWRDLGG